ncbi:MAG TPA: hypothetical protein VD948_04750 [Rhodothermales bacterium]|nr:hypothetical protein [Rhodothermales bacterium]
MPPRPPSLAELLRELDADELREVVTALCKLTPQNRTFVELFLQGSDSVDPGAVLDALTGRLRPCFFSRTQRPLGRPDLAEARRLVIEHERIAADHPALAAEGALVYVELAAAYATGLRERGRFLQTATADAAVRMYERFVRAALARPTLAERLMPRAEAVVGLDRRMRRLLLALQSGDASTLAPEPPEQDPGYRIEYD